MHSTNTSPFPNQNQELILKAALADREVALSAWRQWRSLVDIDFDIDRGSKRLLPLVYQNLRSFDYSDDLISGRVKGIYRRYWLENQKLFYRAGKILERLHNAGIKTAILKGMALTGQVYKNHAVRPMSDADILVPLENARQAVDVVKEAGFHLRTGHLLDKIEFGKGISLIDSDNIEIDLHWHILLHSHGTAATMDFWNNAEPIEIAGIETMVLSATDNFFHTLVHGIYRNPEPSIRWISDAVMIINAENQPIYWQRLLDNSGKLGVLLHVKQALKYLQYHFGIHIPDEIIIQLDSYKPTRMERVVYRHAVQIGGESVNSGFYHRFYTFYARYLSCTNRRGMISIHIGLFLYLVKRLKVRAIGRRSTSKSPY